MTTMPKVPKSKRPAPVALQPVVRCQLRIQCHDLINRIMGYAENPANWPMTQEEQVAFVRTVLFLARRIRSSEDYMAEAVELAAEQLARTSMTSNAALFHPADNAGGAHGKQSKSL